MKEKCLVSTLKYEKIKETLKDTYVRNCVMWPASANCTITVLEDALHQRDNKLLSAMFINRSIKQDFCYWLWAQCSSPVTGVECRVKNNNSLTCLNDDSEPTHAFPWGHVPVGEKMTVPGSSHTSNNTNNFLELLLLQVVKNSPDALFL